MKGGRGWGVFAGLVVVVAILVVVRPGLPEDAPDHRSSSDAPNGTSALRLYAEALGHTTGTVEGTFELRPASALLFVFSPDEAFTREEAQQLQQWVTSGGILVYASERPDARLEEKLGLKRAGATAAAEGITPAPLLSGVRRVSGAPAAVPFVPSKEQVPLLRNARGDVLAVTQHVGRGRVVALADPLELCNGYLKRADNGPLAADLIAMVVPGQPVLFDEYHHHLAARATPTSWINTPWGLAAVWAALLLIVALALRGRAFGPRVPLTSTADRSSAEYARAVGAMLQRTGARTLTLQVLEEATHRAVAARIGLDRGAGGEAFGRALAQRAPAVAQALAEAEGSAPQAASSEAGLLRTAGALHRVAYPGAGITVQETPSPTSPPREGD